MSKLLRADFRRLFKSKFFWITSVIMALLGLLPLNLWRLNKENYAAGYSDQIAFLEDDFFTYVAVMFFMIAVMTALFIGAEYADGTIRNKIVVGQKRIAIYFSNLITLTTAVVIWTVSYLSVALSVGIPLLGMFNCGLSCMVKYTLVALALCVALVSIMLMISMLCSNRTYSSIISLMLVLVMIVLGVVFNSALNEPEYYDCYAYFDTETGEMVKEDETLNPNYVSGVKREIYQEALNIIPGGQMIEITSMTADSLQKLAIYDLILIVLSTGIGIIFWRRKDLK